MAENYFDNKLKDASVNVQRRQKTYEGFERLPEEFTSEDVMRCFNLKSSSAVYMRINRLQKDHLIEKADEFVDGGTTKSRYRKTGVMMSWRTHALTPSHPHITNLIITNDEQ